MVITANSHAYPATGTDQITDIPDSVVVHRAFALDTSRHLAVKGRYLRWMALPDQWVSWLLFALPAALRVVREKPPSVIWSTYPISTAHLIGYFVHRITGLPWVADFRDPMTEFDAATNRRFPPDQSLFRARAWVERLAVTHCTRAVLVTRGALRLYRERYPEIPSSRWALIPNGYDEELFPVSSLNDDPLGRKVGKIRLLHSGVLYPTGDRDPRIFFSALSRLKKDRKISASTVQITLRACGSESLYRQSIATLGIEDIVRIEPMIPYRSALSEMLEVDGLLLFQGTDSNPAIPAKLYEYIRARRPIFALVDRQGDTAELLREIGVGEIVPLNVEEDIRFGFEKFLEQVRNGTAPVADLQCIESHSRRARANDLALLFDDVSAVRFACG